MALKEEYGDRVAFVIVDVKEQEGQELEAEYGITNYPHIIILNSRGDVVLNRAGVGEGEMRNALAQALGQEEAPPAAFKTTPDPVLAVEEALSKGRPVFIEFYSNT